MGDKKKTLFLGLAGTLWLLIVMLAYAYTHKPFSAEQVLVLVKAFWQVTIVVSVTSLAGGLGIKIFPSIKKESPLALLAVQVSLGFGLLTVLILALGSSFGFSTLKFALLLVFGLLILRKESILWWKEWGAFSEIWRKSTAIEKTLAGGVFFILFLTFIKSLAPPLAFDSLVYHLTLPKFYLLEGRVTYTEDLMYWGMPQTVEMLYTFVMALAGVESATLLGWFFGFLTLIGILGYLNLHFSSLAGWVALVALLAGGSLSDSLSWGYVEWALMLYAFGVFVFLTLWASRQERKNLFFAALLTGFAVGIKYTAAIFPIAILPALVFVNRKRGIKHILQDIGLFGGIALLAFSPWLIKNWVATGNPVYPFFFPAGAMDVARISLHQGHSAWGDWRDLFFLPWRATIWGVRGKIGYSADIGALLLGLSAFSWINWKAQKRERQRILVLAWSIMLTGFVLWAIAGRLSLLLLQSRLYFILFPIWAILAGIGFEQLYPLKAGGVRFGRVVFTLLLLSFSFTLFETLTAFSRYDVADVLLGTRTSSSYREQALGKYESAMSTIAALPDDSHVLMLWETRGFSCFPKCEPDEVIDRWYIDLNRYGTSAKVLTAWRNAGYTHLLFYKDGADFVKNDFSEETLIDWNSLDALLINLPLVENLGAYQLYALEP